MTLCRVSLCRMSLCWVSLCWISSYWLSWRHTLTALYSYFSCCKNAENAVIFVTWIFSTSGKGLPSRRLIRFCRVGSRVETRRRIWLKVVRSGKKTVENFFLRRSFYGQVSSSVCTNHQWQIKSSNNSFSGLYYKIIMTIVSDDSKWTLYYKIIMMIESALTLALASVINYDRKWCSILWRHLQSSFWWL